MDDIYDDHFNGDDKFPTTKAMSRPAFDSDLYPNLFNRLAVLPNGQPLNGNLLPIISEDWKAINAKLAKNPFAKALLGFIWKQGEIHTLAYVFKGVRGDKLESHKGSVMYQFGRHLANPQHQPIFDQHTYRAFRLLHAMPRWRSRKTLSGLFESKQGFKLDNVTPAGALREYLDWWTADIDRRLPRKTAKRLLAISAFDRCMFSLGKSAKLQGNSNPAQ